MKNFVCLSAFFALCYFNFSCCTAKPAEVSVSRYIAVENSKGKCNCELGGGLASINGSSESYDAPLAGGQVGFNYEVISSGPVSFTPGVNITAQGSKYHDYVDGSVRLLYLNLPLIGTYLTRSGFYAEAGLQPGFLLLARDKYDGNSENYKDYVRSFDIGVPVGAGYQMKNGIGVGFRAVPGLLNINKNSSDGKDRNLLLMVRATLSIGGRD